MENMTVHAWAVGTAWRQDSTSNPPLAWEHCRGTRLAAPAASSMLPTYPVVDGLYTIIYMQILPGQRAM